VENKVDLPFKAPFTSQNFLKEILILVAMNPVQPVICRHQRKWCAVADCHFEGLEVQLSQGTFWYYRVRFHAVRFRLVGNKVLYGRCNALALEASYVSSRKLAR
jgi:hypothetical protein